MANLSDFLPAAGGGGGGYKNMIKYTTSTTINPSSDLSLEDGATIGYFIVGGGDGGGQINDTTLKIAGNGGYIKHGTLILSNASETITLTIGAGGTGSTTNGVTGTAGGASSISSSTIGTISSADADANRNAGWSATTYTSSYYTTTPAGPGINGYGMGGGVVVYAYGSGSYGSNSNGWGHGGAATSSGGRGLSGGNGAILIYY